MWIPDVFGLASGVFETSLTFLATHAPEMPRETHLADLSLLHGPQELRLHGRSVAQASSVVLLPVTSLASLAPAPSPASSVL